MIFCSVIITVDFPKLTFWENLPSPCSIFNNILVKVKGKGKGHPSRGQERPEGR
jgi:hypothetical protein